MIKLNSKQAEKFLRLEIHKRCSGGKCSKYAFCVRDDRICNNLLETIKKEIMES